MTLPETWLSARLTDVCDLNPRFQKEDRPDDATEVTFVPMSAVDETTGVIAVPEMRTFGEVSKGYTSFRDRDVLFAKVTPCMENGKAAVANSLVNGVGFGSTEFHVLRPTNLVLPEYVLHFVRQKAFRNHAKSSFMGTGGLQRVPASFFSRVLIPLPTLPEQQRIVDILSQADLGSRWQRRRLDMLDSILSAGLDELVLTIDEAQWEAIGAAVQTRYGTSVSADADAESGIPVLRIPNVIGGEVNTSDLKYVELPKAEIERLSLTSDDVLIVRSNGNPDYVGRSAPITEDIVRSPMIYASYLIRLRTDASRLLPEYLSAFLNSPYGRAAMRNAIRTTAGQSNLSGQNLTRVRIPIPPLAQQQSFKVLWQQISSMRQLMAHSNEAAHELLCELTSQGFSGQLTEEWRDRNRVLLASDTSAGVAIVRRRGTGAGPSLQDIKWTDVDGQFARRLNRAWLLDELSEFQLGVFYAFNAYAAQPLLAEDPEIFARFCDSEEVIERLKPFGLALNNRIRRTLSQLSALGLIAKVTLPKQNLETGEREYLKAFRPLRDEEFTRLADVGALRKALGGGGEPMPEIKS